MERKVIAEPKELIRIGELIVMTSVGDKDKELQKRLKEMREGFQEDLQLLKESCIDQKYIETFHSTMGPLIKNILPKKSLLSVIIDVSENIRRGIDYSAEIRKLGDSKKLTEKQRSLLLLFSYLELSEGIFSECVQLIAFILMENHHDLYDTFKMKFVEGYKELDNVSFFLKLQFLEKHGFNFITNEFDRKLRNCIAHLDFIVEDDGTVVNKATGEKLEQIVLEAKNAVLNAIVLMITHVIIKILVFKEIVPPKQSRKKSL